MSAREDLHAVHDAGPIARIAAILSPSGDFETRVPLGLAGANGANSRPLFTIQILTSPVLLRAAILPAMRNIRLLASGSAMVIAFILAWWLAGLTLKPLARISHIIDDIVSGEALPPLSLNQDSRELAIIEAKLNLLGERFRGAREDATHLRSSLEGALEKLDIGTRRQLENQIAVARRLTAINSLTGRVAHEIKNPLNSIALRLEMLRSRLTGEPQDVDEQLSVLSTEVTRLDRVVRTFLDFNRPVNLRMENVDLTEAVAEVIAFIEPEAVARHIRTSFEHSERTIVLEADRDLLRQALLNIAVNALEAMEASNRTEGAQPDAVGDLRIHMEYTEDSCVVAIADTGPGIPADQLEKIFQLYYTTRPQGTGIGLAMAFRAAQLHGGTIEVESEMGKGTEFRIVLPLIDSGRPESTKHSGKLSRRFGTRRHESVRICSARPRALRDHERMCFGRSGEGEGAFGSRCYAGRVAIGTTIGD